MSLPLLQTKLYLPRRAAAQGRPAYVHRARLQEMLTAAIPSKLTLLSAPAGFGKSTLLAEWIHDFGLDAAVASKPISKSQHPKYCWLTLEAGDNDPVRFWTYVIAALQTVHADLGVTALSLLQTPQPPPTEAILTLLLNDLAALPNPCILVLDDYHVIETPAIHEALVFLLDHLPDPFHLVLSSRVDPPLPLARLRARGQLTEIRAAELRFTIDEVTAFLNEVMGLQLSAEDMAALETRTEGWIAGLQLAALAIQGTLSLRGHQDVSAFVRAFTGSHRFIVDYLVEEVIGRQPAEVQAFLLQTALLERLCSSLCNKVSGRTDSQALLERLQQQNLFIIPLDDERKWYRYHHLFADVLRARLQETDAALAVALRPLSGDVRELHRRAATWYEAAGLAEEAIHHTLSAQAFAWAGRLIMQEAQARLGRGEVIVLLRWLQALPDAWVRSQLELHLLHVTLLFLTNQFAEVRQRLPDVERAWSRAQGEPAEATVLFSPQEIPGLIAGLQAELALFHDNFRQAVVLSQQALVQLDRDILGLRSVIGSHFALHYWLRREAEQAYPLLAEFGRVGLYGHEPTTLLALSQQAELKRIQGQYRQAILLFRQLLQLATEAQQPGQWLTTGLAHGMLGFLLYEANELAEAELHARQGIKLGQQGVGVGALFASYLGLAKVLLAQGKLTTAAEVIEAMKQLAQSLDSGVFLSLAALLRVEVGLAQGDWAAVAQWQQASGLQVDDAFDHSSALVYNRLACILVAQGQVDAALTLLSRLIALCEATHWVEGLIKTLAVQAIACLTQHQLEPALASLQRALMLAEPERYIRTFVDLGPPMRLLMLDLRLRINRQSPEQTQRRLLTYIDQLLAVFDPAPPTIADTPSPRSPTIHDPKSLTSGGIIQNLVEPLTRRELEVLHLLAQGLSNQEIADQLIVAKSTLRTHINNLYGKLAVENRLQAVIRSQELGLL